METRQLYGLVCNKCNAKYETFCTPDKLILEIEENKCECGGDLRRDWTFGMGKFNGAGFTKRST